MAESNQDRSPVDKESSHMVLKSFNNSSNKVELECSFEERRSKIKLLAEGPDAIKLAEMCIQTHDRAADLQARQTICEKIADVFKSLFGAFITKWKSGSLEIELMSPNQISTDQLLHALFSGELKNKLNEALGYECFSAISLKKLSKQKMSDATWNEWIDQYKVPPPGQKWKPVITVQKRELEGDTSESSIEKTKLRENVSVPNIRDVFIDLGKPTPLPSEASKLEKRYNSLDAELRDVPFLVNYYCSLSKGTRKEKIYAKLSDIVRCEVQASTNEIRQLAKEASVEKSDLLKQIAKDWEKKQHV